MKIWICDGSDQGLNHQDTITETLKNLEFEILGNTQEDSKDVALESHKEMINEIRSRSIDTLVLHDIDNIEENKLIELLDACFSNNIPVVSPHELQWISSQENEIKM